MWVAFGHHPECRRLTGQGRLCRSASQRVVRFRRATIAAAGALASFGLAYRFALAYRVRAGYPRRNPPQSTPADLGLDFETMLIESDGIPLPGWFIPARGGAPGPGVVLVHGWESARDRTLPMAVFLHAAGFHCLTFDVRGNGANPAEALPLTAGEFGADSLAAFRALIERPEVTVGAIAGHSMGGIGAILAAAADPRVAAVVATSSPAGPYRLTRQTFRLARLPIPDLIAYPLAVLTTRVYSGRVVTRSTAISAAAAIARYEGPVLLAHGETTRSCRRATWSDWRPPPDAATGRRPERGAGRDPGGQGRSALVAVRGCRLSRRHGRVPRPGARRPVGSRRPRPSLRQRPRRASASPTSRRRSRPSRGRRRPADARPGRAAGGDTAAATGPRHGRDGRARRDHRHARWATDDRPSATDPVWRGDRDDPGRPPHSPTVPSSRTTSIGSCTRAGVPAAARTSSAGRSSCAATGTSSGSWPRSVRGPGTSPERPPRSPWSRRTRGAPERPVVDHVRPRAGRPEHGPGGLGARDRQRAGDRLRARLARRLLGYPADQHCEYMLSFGYPADPSDLTRPPPAAGGATLDEMVREERW